MQTIARIAIIFAGSAFFSGCAPIISGTMNGSIDENVAAEKTAKYFGTSRENFTITSFEKSLLVTSYQFKDSGHFYNCTIYYGAVNCKQPGGDGPAVHGDVGVGNHPTAVPVSVSVATNDYGMTQAQAQARLNQLGYPVGAPDGVFGKKSVEKLKLFQKARGLVVNGKLDEPTVTALR